MGIKNISKDVIYVGVNDTKLDLFESQYPIPLGVTYNSYVIRDEKIAVMDTVDNRATDGWFDNLCEAFEGKAPDYLIISHLEPDHAANIERFLTKYPETKLVANAKTIQMLPQFFDFDMEKLSVVEVKEGDTLSLGKHVLRFVMAPMVHWPEVMVEYEETEKILFSADGFGKFGALSDDIFVNAGENAVDIGIGKSEEALESEWAGEARRYYINIVGKYGMNTANLLKKAQTLDIKTIAPLHGPVLSGNLEYFMNKYAKWSSYEAEERGVLIAFASIHGNTKEAAYKLSEYLKQKGEKNVEVFDLSRADMSLAVAESFRYDALVLSGVTYDAGLMPCMEDFLYHLKLKNYQKRSVSIIENGSWGPVAGKLIKTYLESMKNITVCGDMLTIRSTVKKDDEKRLSMLADEIVKR